MTSFLSPQGEKELDRSWQNWIQENLQRGCHPDELFKILLDSGFTETKVCQSMGGYRPSRPLHQIRNPLQGLDPALRDKVNTYLESRPKRTMGDIEGIWETWLTMSLQEGLSRDEVFKVLIDEGFPATKVSEKMGGYIPSCPLNEILNPLVAADLTIDESLYHESYHCSMTKSQDQIKPIEVEQAQIYFIEDFMSANECTDFINLIDLNLYPSTVSTSDSPTDFRTSQTCNLKLVNHPLVRSIDQRISQKLGICLTYSEAIQGQRYAVGQQFKAHTDYFEPGTEEFAKYARQHGQRTWTFMVYLNTTIAGGETQFLSLNHRFNPKIGQAIAWNNLLINGLPNPKTLHCGMPVEAGVKYIITKWFRDKGGGKMLI